MARKAKKLKHPSFKFWGGALAFLLTAVVLALTACWFPQWSRIPYPDFLTSTLGPYVGAVNANSLL